MVSETPVVKILLQETAMFSEYIRDLGKKEGMIEMVADALGLKFVQVPEHISALVA